MRTLEIDDLVLEIGRPKIAVPVTGRNHDEIITQCEDTVEGPCDIIEWRADYYLNAVEELEDKVEKMKIQPDILRILHDIDYVSDSRPVIFTLRGGNQGGEKPINRKTVFDLGRIVAQSKLVSIIDMDLFAEQGPVDVAALKKQVETIHEYGVKVILAYHNFSHMPGREEILNAVKYMRQLGADICKIAVTVNADEQWKELMDICSRVTEGDQGPVIFLAMGKEGVPTRIAGGKVGSCITYAIGTEATAPGQLYAEDLSKILDEWY